MSLRDGRPAWFVKLSERCGRQGNASSSSNDGGYLLTDSLPELISTIPED